MAVMNLVKTNELLMQLKGLLPDVGFEESDDFAWHPENLTISYVLTDLNTKVGQLKLLHEVAHANLDHQNYRFDIELLQLESEAWAKTAKLTPDCGVKYDEDYAQGCLDTYRNWLHQRSTCINCGFISLQIEPSVYKCFNCDASWRVPHTPICRRVAT